MSQTEYIGFGVFVFVVLVIIVRHVLRLHATSVRKATLCEDGWLSHSKTTKGTCAAHGGIRKD